MPYASQPPSLLLRLGLGAASGLLLILSFPKFSLAPLAAFALAPLLVVARNEPSAWKRLLAGFAGGCVFFAGTCYWIYGVQRQFGGLGFLEAAGVFALFTAVLALYWAAFAWLAGYLWTFSWSTPLIPALWVALEYLRAHLFTGFPWLLLGYALLDFFPLARLARWTGVYGLSYLLAAFALSSVWLFFRFARLPGLHLGALLLLGLALLVAPSSEPGAEDQTAYLVQTNIPQQVAFEPWERERQAPLLRRLEDLTLQAAVPQQPPALLIWPEVPASFYFFDDSFTRPFAESLARRTSSHFLMGVVGFVPGSRQTQPTNSAVLLDPSGSLVSRYDKIHLVPFGEYVPLRRWLVIAERLTAEVGDFVPGDRVVVSSLRQSPEAGAPGKLGAFICYEAIFPHLVRQFVQEGAQVLVNISNDGWYGSSAARDQHLLMARGRALENARYLLRATNTGITAAIRPDGSVAQQLPPDQPGVLRARWGYRDERTVYTRYGDWFAQVASLGAVLATAAAGWVGRSRCS